MRDDDLNPFRQAEREREREAETARHYRARHEADRTRAWLKGVSSGDYSEYLRGVDPEVSARVGDTASAPAAHSYALPLQHARLRAAVEAAHSLPQPSVAFWLSLLDAMDLGQPAAALGTLTLLRSSFQTAVGLQQLGSPGGLAMSFDALFRFASQADRISAEMNRLGTMLEEGA